MTEMEKPKRVRIFVDYIDGRITLIPFIADWNTLTHDEKKAAIAFLNKEEEKANEENESKIKEFAIDLMKYKGESNE